MLHSVVIVAVLAAAPQTEATPVADSSRAISLAEALELALTQSYLMQRARLDLRAAEATEGQAWASVYPRVDTRAAYTRNLAAANPFAGSSAGNVFSGLDAVGWLAFNETARTDGDPNTNPTDLADFRQRQLQGMQAAGVVTNPDANPFFVANNFILSVGVRQMLYQGDAIAGIKFTGKQSEVAKASLRRFMHQTVRDVAEAYYGAQLAAKQAEILGKSVERQADTLKEAKRRVAQKVAPRFLELSAEVELTNLQTMQASAVDQVDSARDRLALLVGLPPGVRLRLTDKLPDEPPTVTPPSNAGALELALEHRPELIEARKSVEMLRLREDITFGRFLPQLSAFFNLSLQGSVPDDRSFVVSDPNDPFLFERQELGFFSDAYWFPTANVGVELTWNVFEGFATQSELRVDETNTQRARVNLAELEQGIRLEVEAALRSMTSASNRLNAQGANVGRAELNYEHARLRHKEGVSSALELRDASGQLDQARLAEKQAMHDFLVAWLRYRVAVGDPPGVAEESS